MPVNYDCYMKNKTTSRTLHTVINTSASTAARVVNILLNFVLRTIFIRTLGIQYTGVSGLFTSVLTALSLAELGIGSAITYSLYKPIANRDCRQVARLMNFFKLAYRLVALIVAVAGTCVIPFLGYIVKDIPDIKESVTLIYVLYLLNTVLSYLLIYKSVLLTASQNSYKISLVDIMVDFSRIVINTVLLLIFKNFILYLIVNVGCSVLRNVVISAIAGKDYMQLKEYRNERLPKAERNRLLADIGALAMYTVSGVILGATDDIIISTILGTSFVGIVSNYKLIKGSVDGFLSQFYSALTPSVGNLATESAAGDVQFDVFKKINFASFWVTCFCTTALFSLMDTFIGSVWLGEEFLLPYITIAIVMDFYVTNMIRPVATFRTANGLFVQGKWRPLIMAILNIIFSILLAYPLGVFGVIIATALSRITTQAWFDPWLVYRNVFQKKLSSYLLLYGKYLLITLICCCSVLFLSYLLPIGNVFLKFVAQMCICMIVPNAVIYMIFRKSEELQYFIGALKAVLRKILKKRHKGEMFSASLSICAGNSYKEKILSIRENGSFPNMLLGELQMKIYDELLSKKTALSLVGLGYVGMPIAVAFAKKVNVIGYDINSEKINLYKSGVDPTNEVGNEAVKSTTVEFTADETQLQKAKFHIVAVPTPVNADHTPDLTPVEGASRILGRNLTKGSIVVFESTVYPGVTEDICVPILERESGLRCGVDFKIGYSPERINPGDKVHRLETIIKIVSGMDEETLDTVAKVYELVVKAGVHRAPSIKVAEAAKVIENSQRDINIAFMNELSIIFNKMDIDTKSVLEAAGTKWNFLKFYPGLVGGHCIGIDPYYLTYKAEMLGYHSQVILSGRRINDDMGKYVAENTVKRLIQAEKSVKNARVAILGFTFKENCPDTRNSKVFDIVRELREYGIEPVVADPTADAAEAKHLYGIEFTEISEIKDMDAVILAVAHTCFEKYKIEDMDKLLGSGQKVLVDVKGLFDRNEYEAAGYSYWRL